MATTIRSPLRMNVAIVAAEHGPIGHRRLERERVHVGRPHGNRPAQPGDEVRAESADKPLTQSPIADEPYGSVLVIRDPDNIQLELFTPPTPQPVHPAPRH